MEYYRTKDVRDACYQVLLGRPSSKKDTWQPTFSDRLFISAAIMKNDDDISELWNMLNVEYMSKIISEPQNCQSNSNILNHIRETIVKRYEKIIDELLEYYDDKLEEDY